MHVRESSGLPVCSGMVLHASSLYTPAINGNLWPVSWGHHAPVHVHAYTHWLSSPAPTVYTHPCRRTRRYMYKYTHWYRMHTRTHKHTLPQPSHVRSTLLPSDPIPTLPHQTTFTYHACSTQICTLTLEVNVGVAVDIHASTNWSVRGRFMARREAGETHYMKRLLTISCPCDMHSTTPLPWCTFGDSTLKRGNYWLTTRQHSVTYRCIAIDSTL